MWTHPFDGDCLNIWYLINQEYVRRCEIVFNPRNAMYISKNDGRFNNDINHCRDTLVNANSMIYLTKELYNESQIAHIKALKDKYSK